MSQGPVPQWHPSPNFGPRRDGLSPQLIVLHFTAMATAGAALERLCDPQYEVSAHYLICSQGGVWQMVREEDRAWHAGAGSWRGQQDINSRSIGIELANTGSEPFATAQMDCLEGLMRGIMERWSIPASGVIGHSDMAPLRKADPGPRFDWARLARQGLSVWPQGQEKVQAEADPARFADAARRFGYPAEPDAAVLDAFRQRFRPWARGACLQGQDIAQIEDLAERFGVDQPAGTA